MNINNLLSLATLVMMLGCCDVLASPILQGSVTNPTGVKGLVVDGVEYDATFSTLSYSDTFGAISPTFLGDESRANDASVALAAVLNAAGVTTVDGSACAGNSSTGCLYLFPWFINGQIISSRDTSLFQNYPSAIDWAGATWSTQTSPSFLLGNIGGGYLAYVDLTLVEQVLPEPGSLALLSIGIAGLGLKRRRKGPTRSAPNHS